MRSKPLTCFTVAAATGLLAFAPVAEADSHDHGVHGHDFIIAITGPTLAQADKLAIESSLDAPIELIETSGLIAGWSESDPGFHALPADAPDEGLFTLGDGADIFLEIVAIAEGLRVLTPDFVQFENAGDQVPLSGSDLHTHLTWWAAFDSTWRGTLQATFRLVDLGSTDYADSDPFTLTFTNVPEPASLALMSVGAALVLRRRSKA